MSDKSKMFKAMKMMSSGKDAEEVITTILNLPKSVLKLWEEWHLKNSADGSENSEMLLKILRDGQNRTGEVKAQVIIRQKEVG